MRVAISIAEHEVEMANRWFDWISELGGTDGHSLHLIPVSGLDISALLSKAQMAFRGHVHVQKDEEKETSDWQAKDLIRSAAGPNSAFRQVAWDTYMNKRGPYFWCELDCIPLRKDWLDRLEAEYASCGKPFMGAKVEIENVPLHLSGNAIYPWNVPEVGPTLVMRATWQPSGQEKRFELAFDVAGAKDTIPNAHFTPLIQHIFRHKGFESRQEFDATIDPSAVVFHSCKDGSIFKYLRENLSGVPVLDEPDKSPVDAGSLQESTTASIPRKVTGRDSCGAAQNICDGAGEVNSPGGALIEPAPLQCPTNPIQSDPHPPTGEAPCPRVCPYCNEMEGSGKWCSYCAAWKDPNYSKTSGSPSVVSRTFSPELDAVIAQNAVIKNGLPAMSPPWENREDSERDVKMLCDALSLFCKAPLYKSRVRNALREAKIIK